MALPGILLKDQHSFFLIMEPDKGYAWVILTSCMLTAVLLSDNHASFGVFYVIYTERFDVSKADAGWIYGIKAVMLAVASEYSISIYLYILYVPYVIMQLFTLKKISSICPS